MIYIYIYIHMYVCVYIYIYMYTHNIINSIWISTTQRNRFEIMTRSKRRRCGMRRALREARSADTEVYLFANVSVYVPTIARLFIIHAFEFMLSPTY